MDCKVKVAGIELEHPLMNAAGTCKRLEGAEGLREFVAPSGSAAATMGSTTVEERGGNQGNVFYHEDTFSVNSLGLPNPGMAYFRDHLPEMVKVANDAGKPLVVSIAGFSPEEYAVLADVMVVGGTDLVELNLGCPNVWAASGEQKPIASFVGELIIDILNRVEQKVGVTARVAVKLSPFSNPFDLAGVAEILGTSELVKVVVTTNTFPNALALDEDGQQRISIGAGLAGLGGPAMKPIGLGQVKQLRALLPDRIQIIGVGGIASGQDVVDYLRAGAVAVQIATAFLRQGQSVFTRLLEEYVDVIG